MSANELRALALWGISAFGWALVVTLIAAYVSGGRSLRITHLPLAALTAALGASLALTLAVSARPDPIVNRASLVPIIAWLEFAFFACAWVWYLLVVRHAFCIRPRDC